MAAKSSRTLGGSGLPGLISELNGSKVPQLLTLKTTSLKIAGAVMSVGSGLACGTILFGLPAGMPSSKAGRRRGLGLGLGFRER